MADKTANTKNQEAMNDIHNSGDLSSMMTAMVDVRLTEGRQLFLSEPVTPRTAKRFISDLLWLDADKPGDPIRLYVNSPGGDVNSGYAIFDTIRYIKSPVSIINTGLCASIATVINVAAKKERRYSMPNAKFLIHQPLIPGQIYGQASDIEITARQILKTREKINKLLSDETGAPLEMVEKDTVRDYWMDATEALEYGLVSKVITSVNEIE